jgi:hypothetical protein
MKNITWKIFLSIIFSIFIVACGGGSKTAQPQDYGDNSIIADDDNTRGYYGTKVKFANHKITGEWTFTDSFGDPLNATFSSDGTVSFTGNNLRTRAIDYGVAKDASTIFIAGVMEISIQREVSGNCYNGNFIFLDPYKNTSVTICKIIDESIDSFNFIDINNATFSTVYTSNPITIQGIDGVVKVTLDNGLLIKNDSDIESNTTTVKEGDIIKVKLQSSANFGETISANATIGDLTKIFSITTVEEDY